MLLFTAASCFASNEKTITSVTGSNIKTLVSSPSSLYSMTIKDQKYDFMISSPSIWPCMFVNKNSNTTVVLRFDDSKNNLETGDWTLNVTYTVKLFNLSSASVPYATHVGQIATINYNKAGNNNYSDIFSKTYEGALKAEVTITNVNYIPQNGTPSAIIPLKYNNDIYFDLIQETERYYNMFFSESTPCVKVSPKEPIVYCSVVGNLTTQADLIPYKNQLPIAWNYIQGAESYDVEWVFIDVPSPNTFSAPYNFDFTNATRVNVTQQHYEIPMAFPRGILIYRVRGIGNYSFEDNIEKRVEGPWSVTGGISDNIESNPINSYLCNFEGLDGEYNWQYSASYAEDGKHKEVISYFDGSLRNRQTATILNTDNNVVVAETKYDFQGRPTVQMLPTPLSNSGIHYYSNFNPNFNKEDFDINGNYTSATGAVALVPSTDQTSAYYGNNNVASGSDAFVPDAQGAPYTQTKYKTDGTGRVVAQSGVGLTHMLGKGHDTRYYYGTPSGQEELDRLFGNEVGNVSHYKKNVTVDANGQVSVSYLDQEGRVVATALAGNEPDNLLPIDGKPAPTQMNTDILTGKNLLSGDSRVSKTAIITSQAQTPYSFNYILNWDSTCIAYTNPLNPLDPNLCKICETCVFDLEIKILDEDGTNLLGVTYSGPGVTGLNQVCSNSTAGGLNSIIKCNNIETANYTINVTLPDIGTYYIEKTLKISQTGTQHATTTFNAAVKNPPCGPFTVPLAPPPCNDCEYICNKQYGVNIPTYVTPANPIASATNPIVTVDKFGQDLTNLTEQQSYDEYNACLNNCENIKVMDECEMKTVLLTKDMSPGGQYFDNMRDQINSCSPSVQSNAIDGWLNNLVANTPNFWSNFYSFSTSTANPLNCSPVVPSAVVTLATFSNWTWIRANWKPCFAKFLIQFHPEYSNLKFFCGDMQLCNIADGVFRIFGSTNNGNVDTINVVGYGMKASRLYDKIMSTYNAGNHPASDPILFVNPLHQKCTITANSSSYISNLATVAPTLYTSFPTSIVFKDPFFSKITTRGGIYCSNNIICSSGIQSDVTDLMQSYLSDFYTANSSPSSNSSTFPNQVPMSIWYVLDDPDNIRNPANDPSTPFNSSHINSGATTYFDQATLDFFKSFHSMFLGTNPPTKASIFRSAYLGYKNFLQYGLYHTNYDVNANALAGAYTTQALPIADPNEPGFTSCGYNTSTNALPRAQIRFPRNEIYDMMLANCPNFKPSLASISSFTQSATSSGCESACSAKAEQLVNDITAKIKSCLGTAAPTSSVTLLADLKNDLLSVCLLGCDNTHLQGQSTVILPDYAGTIPSGDNFSQVINTYLNVSPYNANACSTLIASINVIHPTPPYSQAGCTCDAIKEFATSNGIVWNTSNPSLPGLIATKMNSELDVPYTVSSNDVYSWLQTCSAWWLQTSTSTNPDITYLTNSINPNATNPNSGYYNVPLSLVCNSNTQQPDDDFDPCNDANTQQIIDDINYSNALQESTAVQQHLNDFISIYKSKCLSKLDQFEHLTASYELNEYYYTLYYYDQAGNLIKTVPPEGVRPLPVSQTIGTSGNPTTKDVANHRLTPNSVSTPYIWPAHLLITNYKYNTLNSITEQRTPDAGESKFYYDALGRLIASQNAKQAASPTNNVYSYTLYDNLSRIIEVGELQTPNAITTALAKAANFSPNFVVNPTYGNIKRQVTRTYYDEMPSQSYTDAASLVTYFNPLSDKMKGIYATGMQGYLRNRVSCVTYIENDYSYGTSTSFYDNATHYSYDIHGNVKTLYTENKDLDAFDYSINRVDYNYDLLSGKVNEVHFNAGKVDQFHHKYEYDADNRITIAYTSRNGILWEKESKYFYYKHGPLFRTEIGDKQVQATDYAYTLHGWIKGVNSDALDKSHDIGQDGLNTVTNNKLNSVFAKDAYSYSLNYYKNDYVPKNPLESSFTALNTNNFLPNTIPNVASQSAELFNGNIAMMATNIYVEPTVGSPLVASPIIKAYRYDQLNRIKNAQSYQGITSNQWTSTAALTDNYKESFIYDFNGNIKTAQRYNNSANLIDNLTYNYNYSGTDLLNNKLMTVNDPITSSAFSYDLDDQGSSNYNYDQIGNLTEDASEGIGANGIVWNVYGKIKSITRVAGNKKPDLEFVYDAQGNRIEKLVKPKDQTTGVLLPSSAWQKTYYVRDAQGNVMVTYKEENVSGQQVLKLDEQHIYGSSRLGLLKNNSVRIDQNTEILHKSSFETTTNGWNAVGSSVSIDANQRLKVTLNANTQWSGVDFYPTLQGGKTYEVSFDIDKTEIGTDPFWAIVLDYTTPWRDVQTMKPVQGHNTYRFTTWSSNTIIKFQNNSATNAANSFYLDNIVIKEIDNDRVLGEKQYELSNHLGNVLTTVSDRKIIEEGSVIGLSNDYEVPFNFRDNTYALSGNYSCKLSNNFSPNFRPQVYPGDNLVATVKSYYTLATLPTGVNSAGLLIISLVDQYGNFVYDASGNVIWFAAAAPTTPNSWQPINLNVTVPTILYTDASHTTVFTGSIYANSHCWNPNNTFDVWMDDHTLTVNHGAAHVLGYNADIRSSNDYYAFGAPMPGRNYQSSSSYRYGFNGKENDNEVVSTGEGTQDYGLRIYNPALGRFLSVDPLTADYPWYTPYQFAGNKPIQNIDLDGGEELNAANTGGVTPTSSNEPKENTPSVRKECEGSGCQTITSPNAGGTGGYNVSIPAGAKIITQQQQIVKDHTTEVTTQFAYDEGGETFYYQWKADMNAYYSYYRNEVYGGEGVGFVNGYMNTTWGTDWGSTTQPGYSGGARFGSFQNTVNTGAAIGGGIQLGYVGLRFGLRFATTRAMNYVTKRYALQFPVTEGVGAAARGHQIDGAFFANYKNNVVLRTMNYLDLIQPGRSTKYPDLMGKGILRDTWWDIHTPGTYKAHLRKYADPESSKFYGKIGIGIFYTN